MSRAEIAGQLVRQKAILDVLRDMDGETRQIARTEYKVGDADAVDDLGRVQMIKGRKSAVVIDWTEFTRWVEEHIPEGIITTTQVNPGLRDRLLKSGGTWTNPDTGEVHEIAGVGVTESPGTLRVTTTDVGEEWAISALRGAKAIE